jgi:Tfp pilus assembly protein PilF
VRIYIKRLLTVLFLVAALRAGSSAQNTAAKFVDATKSATGSEACAGCHSEIYKSYKKTVMANASGVARGGLITGEFLHKPSGVKYKVFERDGSSRTALDTSESETRTHTGPLHAAPGTESASTVWMSYQRDGESGFRGERELLYFIGSGVKGRTYLFSVDGFLYEAPINWYTQEKRWNMAPAYTEAKESPLNLPAFVDCLNCHSSDVQAPVAGTDSKFAGAPFLHAGITCQRCHGGGDGHMNPAKLSPERRDAICMECHFEGTVAERQPGKQIYDFQPGERLSDYLHYFLLTGEPQKAEALSQFEALSQSTCKRKSGDKMWCGSCHDPHAEPAAEEKVAYYRGKCLNCHGEAFAAKHHADKPDCRQCHMPALPSKDVAHTEGTDHRIQRYPSAQALPQLEVRGPQGAPLVPFPASDAELVTTRDVALAWEALAQRGVGGASHEAEQYLRKAVKERPDDAALLSALGFVEQQHGHEKEARELYERALKNDPLANDAATNLGIMEARAGNLRRAVELWQGAFARVPDRSAIGMNLAVVFCVAGQKDVARKYVMRVLDFNPDYGKAKSLLGNMSRDAGECRP